MREREREREGEIKNEKETTAKRGMHFLPRRQIARNDCRTTAAEL